MSTTNSDNTTNNNTTTTNSDNTNNNNKKVSIDKEKGLIFLNNKIINKPHTVKHNIPKR